MRTHAVSVLAGDGIGPEVMPEAMAVLDDAVAPHGIRFEWREHPWGSDYYRRHGRMMPTDAIETMAETDAVFLGAVGDPAVSDVETLWGMLIPIRREFDQYVNLRPVRSFRGIASSLAGDPEIDLVIVRENVEGEYSEVGGRAYRGTPYEAAYQQALFTRFGVERVARFAVERARERSGRIVSATKSNGIIHTMPFWDEVVAEVVAHADANLQLESVLIDALAARMVRSPQSLDVIVASNLFGDILSDLAAGAVGSIGIAPSANLNPERRYPSMFEPVHGSAPDIAGRGVANPIGQIWAGAMMLRHFGYCEIAEQVESAFTGVIEAGIVTPDLGGSSTTVEVGSAVRARLADQGGAS
ncbi:tartrate dehydrogenase [Leucobacter sp. Psy1]|uniref:isocitrate/isopropylmalate dehydrogenase family protein n=1 Tax=Leucobacter sp. Psy1 TaxID=2875729 RepID=UPI001CD3DDF7|nr:isocitrate/isopropylmalate family dehydrogenase [Leucobacter sp. Psy1]UBH07439.1 tartrate dehydrogenase [Leucobacter sp. Psy1]